MSGWGGLALGIRDVMTHCVSPLAALLNGAYLTHDSTDAIYTKCEGLLTYLVTRATFSAATMRLVADRYFTVPLAMHSRHVTCA